VYWSFFVVYLNIIERSSQLNSATGELLVDKVVRAFKFALLWLGNFKSQVTQLGDRPVLLQELC